MYWWKEAFDKRRRARDWDAPRTEDETVTECKSLFEAARENAPAPDEKMWEKLRPQLVAHEAQVQGTFSFVSALATTGPRFAAAVLGVMLIIASLFWSQGVRIQMQTLEPRASLMVSLERNPLNPIMMIGNGLEAETGQDLLQYAIYDSPAHLGILRREQ